jgi:hypothetical protein
VASLIKNTEVKYSGKFDYGYGNDVPWARGKFPAPWPGSRQPSLA